MVTSDWIALSALIVSVGTAIFTLSWRWISLRRADVTAFLHWLPARAYISVDGCDDVSVGYHLVLWNRGPARARLVDVEVHFMDGEEAETLRLTDVAPGELPLAQLDPGARYPIPWALGEDGLARSDERRFVLTLSWTDSRSRSVQVPIRRGNVGS
ncbi:hypothetical protein [Nocardioides cavernaquae]|uniref:DUF1616 domain-containing protein n=1 Tax=Nocardioides cavernaquae TaxID=2321396 RepID=A0A3A5H9V8_9ACTN|nr:hypothetical protein [Nocardioides cavernaquae]RJS47416.1 hypothetical protein D4739_15135 [Nocardioides cavernaquae]